MPRKCASSWIILHEIHLRTEFNSRIGNFYCGFHHRFLHGLSHRNLLNDYHCRHGCRFFNLFLNFDIFNHDLNAAFDFLLLHNNNSCLLFLLQSFFDRWNRKHSRLGLLYLELLNLGFHNLGLHNLGRCLRSTRCLRFRFLSFWSWLFWLWNVVGSFGHSRLRFVAPHGSSNRCEGSESSRQTTTKLLAFAKLFTVFLYSSRRTRRVVCLGHDFLVGNNRSGLAWFPSRCLAREIQDNHRIIVLLRTVLRFWFIPLYNVGMDFVVVFSAMFITPVHFPFFTTSSVVLQCACCLDLLLSVHFFVRNGKSCHLDHVLHLPDHRLCLLGCAFCFNSFFTDNRVRRETDKIFLFHQFLDCIRLGTNEIQENCLGFVHVTIGHRREPRNIRSLRIIFGNSTLNVWNWEAINGLVF
mmetsp:Transcript_9052/g.14022  ORF Transcript_9052/g.14022 Transcript_9052/m.14022 type:complete len:410 (+) Transcript_9052:401-1630(+)